MFGSVGAHRILRRAQRTNRPSPFKGHSCLEIAVYGPVPVVQGKNASYCFGCGRSRRALQRTTNPVEKSSTQLVTTRALGLVRARVQKPSVSAEIRGGCATIVTTRSAWDELITEGCIIESPDSSQHRSGKRVGDNLTGHSYIHGKYTHKGNQREPPIHTGP